MPPRDPKPANNRPKYEPKPKLDIAGTRTHRDAREVLRPTPARFRPASHPNQGQVAQALPQPTAERSPKAQNAWLPCKARQQAVTEWLLAMFDAGTELRVIQRMSAFTDEQSNKQAAKPPWTPPVDQPRRTSSSEIQTESRPEYLGSTPTGNSCTGRLTAPSRPITRKNASRTAMYRSPVPAGQLPKQFGP